MERVHDPDEYIAVVDVTQYRADMDCFILLMERFYQTYGFYPKYPIADAGYGSYRNYIYCEQHGMEKHFVLPTGKPYAETNMAVKKKYIFVKTVADVLMLPSVKNQRKTGRYV